MKATVLDDSSSRQVVLTAVAMGLSLVAHVGVAVAVARIEVVEEDGPVWMEMVVQEVQQVEVVEPEPEPVVEPEPEPEPKVVPEPEVVEFEETTPEPEPVVEPDPEPVPRRVQGLSVDSFGTGTGLTVRRGTTLATKASDETMSLDDEGEFVTVPYTSVTTAPQIRAKPTLNIPPEVIEAEIQGRVEVELTIGADGAVLAGVVVGPLHPAADVACLADLRRTKWRPGTRDGVAVIVQGVPFSCRYEMAVD